MYNHQSIEKKWKVRWEKSKIGKKRRGNLDESKFIQLQEK